MTTPSDETPRRDPERRCYSRLVPDSPTTIRLSAGERRYDCQVEDISLSGIKLRPMSKLPADDRFVLEHKAGGKFVGKPVWRSRTALGIAFELPEKDLERALQCISILVNPDLDLTVL
ncbi:MAG: PilZ domain-containing protein [Planctomycetota bacterium]